MKFLTSIFILCALVITAGAQSITSALPIRDKTYYVEAYGAKSGDSTDDKTAIQNCIDACESAGGGIVQFGKGRYIVAPAATGKGLWHDGDLSVLQGLGEVTEIQAKTTTSSAAFCLIAPRDYNNIPSDAAYGGNPIYVRNLRLTSDCYATSSAIDASGWDADAGNCHDLIGIGHCPWAIVEKVGFEQGFYHAFEINVSKNVRVSDCYIYGTGNFSGPIIELDARGSMGIIDTGPPTSSPIENILIERFNQRTGRANSLIGGGASFYEGILLSHTVSRGTNLRNVVIRDCNFVPHSDTAITGTGSFFSSVISFDSAAYPGFVDGLTIEGCTFKGGGWTGSTQLIDLSCSGNASSQLRNITIRNNRADCPMFRFIQVGANGNYADPATSITAANYPTWLNTVIEGNTCRLGINGNALGGARSNRTIVVEAGRNVRCINNSIVVPNQSLGSTWTSGGSTIGAKNFGFWFENVQYLECIGNTVEMAMPSATISTLNYQAFVFSAGAMELSGSGPLPGNWIVMNNHVYGNGTIGNNLGAAYVELLASPTTIRSAWANPAAPSVSGIWYGNTATNSGTFYQTLYTDFPVTTTAVTSSTQTLAGMAALGVHSNWAPSGEVVQTFSNAAVTVNPATTLLVQTGTMSASRVVTIPYAMMGRELKVVDASGSVTGVNTLVLTRQGADTINGATTYTLNAAYDQAIITPNGNAAWTVLVP